VVIKLPTIGELNCNKIDNVEMLLKGWLMFGCSDLLGRLDHGLSRLQCAGICVVYMVCLPEIRLMGSAGLMHNLLKMMVIAD